MGDPGKKRRKYSGPNHPWSKERIDEENILRKEYGTKNKKEIYRLDSLLRKFKGEAKRLIPLTSEQAELEKKQLLAKLQALKLLPQDAKLDNVLAISLKDLMERRIQTLLVRKGLARTPKQARQFITHKHVMVNGKLITSPSTLLAVEQEGTLEFIPTSTLANPTHPEREIKKEEEEKPKKKKKKPRERRGKERSEKKPRKPKKEKKEKPKEEKKE
ncbi:30S ribosomal protein S4 [Candidatus Woesearchaeota archaeon]|nr:30S ribosomal protein S4 [Candidatus Woesearchaeota archaeon]